MSGIYKRTMTANPLSDVSTGRRRALVAALLAPFLLGTFATPAAAAPRSDPTRKIASRLLADTAQGEQASCIVLLADQADLSAAYGIHDPDARGWYVYNTLREQSRRSQARLRAWLRARGVQYRSLWAANAVVATGDRVLLDDLAARGDVRTIESNRAARWIEDPPNANTTIAADTTGTVEWNVANVNAPQVWAMGYTGQGIVIGNQDTGMQWDHPALEPHYRGWNAGTVDHNFNWHDAIHTSGGVCGASSPFPCDDDGHGTHTTGIAVGNDDAGNRIGVAPGAQWIGCRNMDQGHGTPATYAECFQFFMAPTDLNGENPDPTRRPHVINNSWSCPPEEGCAPNTLQTIVENTEAAGIFVEVSAGNYGPSCSTVRDPAAIYAAAFSTGAYDIMNTLADFSSRGPVTVDGSNRLKPDIAAPGVNVRSSLRGNTYGNRSGTSMAGPHVVGVVALLWSARPQLARDIATTKAILENTANPSVTVSSEICGDTSGATIPNNLFGYGRVDALAAVDSVPLAPTPTATSTQVPASTSTPTLTPTATPTQTPTPTTAYSLSGHIRYYAGNRDVPNASVHLNGAPQQSSVTDGSGAFDLLNVVPGTCTLDPTKDGDWGSAVTALDAVYVLQSALGLRAFDAMQSLACDVSGNGSLTALDAVYILQFNVGLITHLPVAQTCGSDWAFIPMPAGAPHQRLIQPQSTSGTCQRGGIAFEPLASSAANQDFLAVLFGDCTGNWQPSATGGGAASYAPVSTQAGVRLGRPYSRGRRIRLPLYIDSSRPFHALQIQLAYDPTRVSGVTVRTAPATRSALLVFNTRVPGRVTIALASPQPVSRRNGSVLLVQFESHERHLPVDAIRLLRSVVDGQATH